jgi:hypothetical protein
MNPARGIDGPALAIALFAGAAVAAVIGLLWLSTPAEFNGRLAQVRAQIEKSELALRKAPRTTYPPDAICAQAPEQAVAALKSRLQNGASAVGVTLIGLNVVASSGAPGSTVAPVNLQFEASAPYDKIIALVVSLGRGGPEIFVDSADLTSQVSSADLKLAGRVYCSVRP